MEVVVTTYLQEDRQQSSRGSRGRQAADLQSQAAQAVTKQCTWGLSGTADRVVWCS